MPISIREPPTKLPVESSHRPDVDIAKQMLAALPGLTIEELKEQAIELGMGAGSDIHILTALLCKSRGVELYARKDMAGARKQYMRGVKELLGVDDLPILDFRQRYMKLSATEFLDLGALCNNIALTYAGEQNTDQALFWLEEQGYVFYCQMLKNTPVDQEWKSMNMTAAEYYVIGARAYKRRGDIYNALNNTGHASRMYCEGNTHCESVTWGAAPDMDKTKDSWMSAYHRLLRLRHPDASLANIMHTITEPGLQIRGSWQKKRIQGSNITSRMGASVFIWRSRLYVLGGRHTSKSDKQLFDFHYLSLTADPLQSWTQLPPIPKPSEWQSSGPFNRTGRWNAVLVENTVWLFLGIKQVAKFNLESEKWTLVKTTLDGSESWPYKQRLQAFAMTAHKGIIYVFGGHDPENLIGNNVLFALDTGTLKWKRLSGTPAPKVNKLLPGLRTNPECWVCPAQEKLYILYGSAERTAADLKLLYTGHDFTYQDMWSFHIPTSKWLQERLHGNSPCPRTEFSSTYNPVLNRTFLYGGYIAFLPSGLDDTSQPMFGYSYFADTFMWTPETNTWAQVMTHGFPTHRALPSLVSDPDTGRVYLFGGYSNTEFTGAGSAVTRNYAEVWQLCIDLPGGDLEKVNLEDEARLAKLGVDRRCFNCGEVGRFSKCGGTCQGKVSFCSKVCLADAWVEHRQKHNCRKAK